MTNITLNYILENGSVEGLTEEDTIRLLTEADDLYYNDSPVLTDQIYDIVRLEAQQLYPTNLYFTGVGSKVRGGKIKLPYTMGSLNQIYKGDLVKWIDECKLSKETLVISHKLDGASNMIVYAPSGELQIAYSRGDGVQGADITRHITKIHNVPQRIENNGQTITVRAETIISPKNFSVMKNKFARSGGTSYKNPRNAVSGLMNSSENDDNVYQYIDVVAYEIVGSTLSKSQQLILLAGLGFSVVKHQVSVANSLSDVVLTKILKEARTITEYEIDGLVIDINSSEVRSKLKTDSLNPKYAVKFKVADASNLAHAKVIGVELNISKHGYIKPTIEIEPTVLMGVTITKCTGFNMKFIYDNKIQPGCTIRLTRSGDVIPFCLGVSFAGPLV